MSRKAITERMKVDCLLWRVVVVCTHCARQIYPGQKIEWDHIHSLSAGGPHVFDNLRPIHYACHKDKTKTDIALNAKAKRIAKGGRKRKGPKMKSRGFQKAPPGYKHRWGKRKPRVPRPTGESP